MSSLPPQASGLTPMGKPRPTTTMKKVKNLAMNWNKEFAHQKKQAPPSPHSSESRQQDYAKTKKSKRSRIEQVYHTPKDIATLLSGFDVREIISGLKYLEKTIVSFDLTTVKEKNKKISGDDMEDGEDGYASSSSTSSISPSSSSSSSSNSNSDSDSNTTQIDPLEKALQKWSRDTSSYNVPFVPTKLLSSTSTHLPKYKQKPWGALAFLTISSELHEVLGDALWSTGSIVGRDLNKSKKLRRLGISLQITHLNLLSTLLQALRSIVNAHLTQTRKLSSSELDLLINILPKVKRSLSKTNFRVLTSGITPGMTGAVNYGIAVGCLKVLDGLCLLFSVALPQPLNDDDDDDGDDGDGEDDVSLKRNEIEAALMIGNNVGRDVFMRVENIVGGKGGRGLIGKWGNNNNNNSNNRNNKVDDEENAINIIKNKKATTSNNNRQQKPNNIKHQIRKAEKQQTKYCTRSRVIKLISTLCTCTEFDSVLFKSMFKNSSSNGRDSFSNSNSNGESNKPDILSLIFRNIDLPLPIPTHDTVTSASAASSLAKFELNPSNTKVYIHSLTSLLSALHSNPRISISQEAGGRVCRLGMRGLGGLGYVEATSPASPSSSSSAEIAYFESAVKCELNAMKLALYNRARDVFQMIVKPWFEGRAVYASRVVGGWLANVGVFRDVQLLVSNASESEYESGVSDDDDDDKEKRGEVTNKTYLITTLEVLPLQVLSNYLKLIPKPEDDYANSNSNSSSIKSSKRPLNPLLLNEVDGDGDIEIGGVKKVYNSNSSGASSAFNSNSNSNSNSTIGSTPETERWSQWYEYLRELIESCLTSGNIALLLNPSTSTSSSITSSTPSNTLKTRTKKQMEFCKNVITSILTPPFFQRKTLNRAILSGDSFLIQLSLMLIDTIVCKFHEVCVDFVEFGFDRDGYRDVIGDAVDDDRGGGVGIGGGFVKSLENRMPNGQALLSLKARFDPFASSPSLSNNGVASKNKSKRSTQTQSNTYEESNANANANDEKLRLRNTNVTYSLLQLITTLTVSLPQVIRSIKFDFFKLLPSSSSGFVLMSSNSASTSTSTSTSKNLIPLVLRLKICSTIASILNVVGENGINTVGGMKDFQSLRGVLEMIVLLSEKLKKVDDDDDDDGDEYEDSQALRQQLKHLAIKTILVILPPQHPTSSTLLADFKSTQFFFANALICSDKLSASVVKAIICVVDVTVKNSVLYSILPVEIWTNMNANTNTNTEAHSSAQSSSALTPYISFSPLITGLIVEYVKRLMKVNNKEMKNDEDEQFKVYVEGIINAGIKFVRHPEVFGRVVFELYNKGGVGRELRLNVVEFMGKSGGVGGGIETDDDNDDEDDGEELTDENILEVTRSQLFNLQHCSPSNCTSLKSKSKSFRLKTLSSLLQKSASSTSSTSSTSALLVENVVDSIFSHPFFETSKQPGDGDGEEGRWFEICTEAIELLSLALQLSPNSPNSQHQHQHNPSVLNFVDYVITDAILNISKNAMSAISVAKMHLVVRNLPAVQLHRFVSAVVECVELDYKPRAKVKAKTSQSQSQGVTLLDYLYNILEILSPSSSASVSTEDEDEDEDASTSEAGAEAEVKDVIPTNLPYLKIITLLNTTSVSVSQNLKAQLSMLLSRAISNSNSISSNGNGNGNELIDTSNIISTLLATVSPVRKASKFPMLLKAMVEHYPGLFGVSFIELLKDERSTLTLNVTNNNVNVDDDDDDVIRINDDIVLTFLKAVNAMNSGTETLLSDPTTIANVIGERCLNLDSNSNLTTDKIEIIGLLPSLLNFAKGDDDNVISDSTSLLFTSISIALTTMLSEINDNTRSRPDVMLERCLIEASLNILAFDTVGLCRDTSLLTVLLVRLFGVLPRSLRKYATSNSDRKTKTGGKTGGKTDEHPPLFIVTCIFKIIAFFDVGRGSSSSNQNQIKFDDEICAANADVINAAVLSLLKYGITNASLTVTPQRADSDSGSESDSKYYLNVISALVSLFCMSSSSSSSSPFADMRIITSALHSLNPEKLWLLTCSHSLFSAALSNGSTVKLPLLNLLSQLLKSASASASASAAGESKAQALTCDANLVPRLMQAYNASVSVEDYAIRRLLYELESVCGPEVIGSLERCQWGMASSSSSFSSSAAGAGVKYNSYNAGLGNFGKWSWFVAAFEERRVRATLCDFPLYDKLVPEEDSVGVSDNVDGAGIGSGSKWSKGLKGLKVDSSADLNDYGDNNHTGHSHIHSHSRSHCETDTQTPAQTQAQEDLRYSPAFLLPLALTSLESFIPTNAGPAPDRRSYPTLEAMEACPLFQKYTRRVETFANYTRRFCDCGVVQIALMSMSLKDLELRKLAALVLTLTMYGLESTEAKKIAGWSGRPQLVMLLSSVLRAVGRQLPFKPREGTGTGEGASTSATATARAVDVFYISPMPLISALFLARSCLILSRPTDPLYAGINGYFLRLSADVGAFKDIRGLPAFGQLFCSSSLDGKARVERMWAERLIRDGVRDAWSYKVCGRGRFANVLMMSSFDSLASVQAGEQDGGGSGSSGGENTTEKKVLLEALNSMIQRGGKGGVSSMVENIGVLSWFKGVCDRDWGSWAEDVRGVYLETLKGALVKAKDLGEVVEEEVVEIEEDEDDDDSGSNSGSESEDEDADDANNENENENENEDDDNAENDVKMQTKTQEIKYKHVEVTKKPSSASSLSSAASVVRMEARGLEVTLLRIYKAEVTAERKSSDRVIGLLGSCFVALSDLDSKKKEGYDCNSDSIEGEGEVEGFARIGGFAITDVKQFCLFFNSSLKIIEAACSFISLDLSLSTCADAVDFVGYILPFLPHSPSVVLSKVLSLIRSFVSSSSAMDRKKLSSHFLESFEDVTTLDTNCKRRWVKACVLLFDHSESESRSPLSSMSSMSVSAFDGFEEWNEDGRDGDYWCHVAIEIAFCALGRNGGERRDNVGGFVGRVVKRLRGEGREEEVDGDEVEEVKEGKGGSGKRGRGEEEPKSANKAKVNRTKK